jgi:TolA-binding protein
LGETGKAIEDYKRIIDNYSTHSVAIEALSGLQSSLSTADRSEEFQPYREEYSKNNPETGSLVNIDYETAKSLYNAQKYGKAIESFKKYLERYPESPNIADAKFYLAESYLKDNQIDKALEEFNTVINERKSNYYTRSILRVADIYFNNKQYNKALDYYQKLLAESNNGKERSIAWASLMETYFKLEKYDSVQYYADHILTHSKYSMDANKASLYLGKVAYKKGNYDKAIDNFISTINMAKDENAAEAKYMIARIQYDQKKYKESLETLYDLNNVYYVYDKWLGKSFLLIADNFIAMDEIFQAKATLQSIIDKATDKETVEAAKKKLQQLEANEKEGGNNE